MKRTLTLRGVKRNNLKEYQTSTSIPKAKRIKRTSIKSLARHFMWRLGIWRRGAFNSWVATFSPEIVIIQSGDTAFTHDLARNIANQYQAKLVFFNTEGIYFLNDDELLDAAAHYRRWWNKVNHAGSLSVIDSTGSEPLSDSDYRWW